MESSLFRSASQMADANNYNDWTFGLFARRLRGRILEVGCGVGTFTSRMLAHGGFESILSVDVAPEAVAHCQVTLQHPAIEFRCVDVREVEGRFDTIICMNVLEHIADDKDALGRMMRLLTPAGTLFLLVPAHQQLYTPFDLAAGHVRRYGKRDMLRLLRDAAPVARLEIEQFYFNMIGAVGYWFVYGALRRVPNAGAAGEIGAFDRWIVPVMRRLEGRRQPFGLSLVSIVSCVEGA